MPDKSLPARPNLAQYKKQSKDLAHDIAQANPGAQARFKRHHPRFKNLPETALATTPCSLTDAQLVVAREHGFESWPKFAKHLETLELLRRLDDNLSDPVSVFLEVALVPRHESHTAGTLEHAELVLARYPQVATANIYTASVMANESAVREFLSRDKNAATKKGGPHNWDALTHLCFSRYLRLDKSRSTAFVKTATALLDAGANPNTGWYEPTHEPAPTFESVLYGAAGLAQNADLTRLLLSRGADPNDDETPYHAPETYDNTVVQILLDSKKLTPANLVTLLIRKTDLHDEPGVRLLLEHGADPNFMPIFGNTALQHALRRNNRLSIIALLLDHGADPNLTSSRDGKSGAQIAARRGRADVLNLFAERHLTLNLNALDQLIAACAKDDRAALTQLTTQNPTLKQQLVAEGGNLLTEFATTGNTAGLRNLLDLGVSPAAPYLDGDSYFDHPKGTTALHAAAWHAWPESVRELIAHGAPVNIQDAKGRTPLYLAVKANVDSYWTNRRTPESVAALLNAGATLEGISVPSGYEEVDALLRQNR